MKKPRFLAAIVSFSLVVALFTAFPMVASADFCTDLSDEFAGFLDCTDQFSSFTDFEGGLEAPDTEGYDESLTQATDARTYVKNIANFALGFLGFVAILIIIYSGFLYVTSRGESEPMEKGKKGIMYAVVGILIILGSFAIVNTVLQAPGGDANNISQDGQVRGTAGGARSSTNTAQLANFNSAAEEVKDVTREYLDTYEQFQQRNIQLQTLLTYQPNEFTRRSDFVDYLDYLKSELRKIQRTSGNLSYTGVAIEAVIAQVLNPGIQEIAETNRAEDEDFIQDTAFENDFKNFFEDIGRGASEWANGLFGSSSAIKKNFECSLPPDERSVEYSLSNCSEGQQDKDNTKLGSNIDAAFDDLLEELVIEQGLYLDYNEELENYELRIQNIYDSLRVSTSSENAIAGDVAEQFEAVLESLGGGVKADNISLEYKGLEENPFDDGGSNVDIEIDIESIEAVKDFIVELQDLYLALKELRFTAPVIVANVARGSAPLIVTFDGTASYDPSEQTITDGQYEWDPDGDGDFGNSSNSNVNCEGANFSSASITCVYTEPGSYRAALRVKSSEDTIIQTGVTYLPIRVTPPTARIDLNVKPGGDSEPLVLREYDADGNLAIDVSSFSVTLAEANQGLVFDASGTEDQETGSKSKIVKYEWFFGDTASQVTGSGKDVKGGSTNTGSDNAKSVTRKFSQRGRYNAYLAVTDQQGNTDRKIFDVIVTSTVARISADITSGNPGDMFTFDGSGSKTDSGSVTDYRWSVNGDTNIEGNDKETFKYKFDEPGEYSVSLQVEDGAGNKNEMTVDITIESQAPRALFNVTFPEQNRPSYVVLDASESFDPDPNDNDSLTYFWRIFNAAQGTDFTIESGALNGNKEEAGRLELLFNRKGTYKVELRVEDKHTGELKKTSSVSRDVIIRNLIDVAFAESQGYASQLEIAADGSLKAEATFDIESKNGEIVDIDFGDGAKDTQRIANGKVQFKHNYTSSKAYNVNIKVNKGSDSNTLKAVYIVGGGDEPIAIPKVKIGGSSYSNIDELPKVYKGTTVTFDASSSINSDGTNSNLRYSWNFGDTKSSTKSLDTNTYNDVAPRDPGYFEIVLTVTDTRDGTKTSERRFKLYVEPAVPTAQTVLVTPLGGSTTPFNAKVEVVGASDKDGRVVQYRFYYFPLSDTQQELGVKVTDVPTTILTFGVFGQSGDKVDYGVCVDLKDDEGNEVKCSELFEDGQPATVKTTNGQNLPPSAKYKVDKTSINVGETIIFQDESKDPDGKIVEWVYDFDGDGSFTNDQVYEQPQVSHTYTERSPKDGYSVRLRIRDDKGAYSTSAPLSIFVEGKLEEPKAAFTYLAPDLNVVFQNNSEADEDNGGTIAKYEWDFDTSLDSDGDGEADNDVDATTANPTHRYMRDGTYNVKLTIEDNEGNEVSVVRPVVAQAIPANKANPYANSAIPPSSTSGSAPEIDEPLMNLIRTIPPVNADTDAITLTGNSADVVFNFDHLPANIVKIMIDKNVYFDTNGGRPGTFGDGVRNNDVDYESTTRNPYRTNFAREWGQTRVQLAVVDSSGRVYTDQADVVFQNNNLQAKLAFDPTDNIPAFIYFIVLIMVILYGNYAIKKQSRKSKKKIF